MIIDNSIEELNFLDKIERLETEYAKEYGFPAIKLSDWNPSKHMKQKLSEHLCMPSTRDPIDYIFSYSIECNTKVEVIKRLGISRSQDKGVLFTHSGSASILTVIQFLSKHGIKILYVLCPAYFTLFYVCKDYGIEVKCIYIEREDSFVFPDIIINSMPNDAAIWITNPIYCTSVYYPKSYIDSIRSQLNGNVWIIADECLAITRERLGQQLGEYEKFIGIYSPHKSVCTNGNKFSAIIFNTVFQDEFDAWADVFCGCLGTSNYMAIDHYLSPSFEIYCTAFNSLISDNFASVVRICEKYSVSFDRMAHGYLVTLYFPNILAREGMCEEFVRKTLWNTGVTFIPGIRNHFSERIGLSFRVNLAAIDDIYLIHLEKCLQYLTR